MTATLTYEYQVQGDNGRVKMTGEVAGDTLQGSYQSTGGDGEKGGTWKVSRTP